MWVGLKLANNTIPRKGTSQPGPDVVCLVDLSAWCQVDLGQRRMSVKSQNFSSPSQNLICFKENLLSRNNSQNLVTHSQNLVISETSLKLFKPV